MLERRGPLTAGHPREETSALHTLWMDRGQQGRLLLAQAKKRSGNYKAGKTNQDGSRLEGGKPAITYSAPAQAHRAQGIRVALEIPQNKCKEVSVGWMG